MVGGRSRCGTGGGGGGEGGGWGLAGTHTRNEARLAGMFSVCMLLQW